MSIKELKNKLMSNKRFAAEYKRLTSEFARSGGQATFKKHGLAHMKRIAKLAVKARWGNRK